MRFLACGDFLQEKPEKTAPGYFPSELIFYLSTKRVIFISKWSQGGFFSSSPFS
jgi:hypothetical protein